MTLHQALQRAMHLTLLSTLLLLALAPSALAIVTPQDKPSTPRQRTSLNTNWRFHRWESNPDNLVYDLRPDHENLTNRDSLQILKPWILPSANAFLADPASHHQPPPADVPVPDAPYAHATFNDTAWESVTLPHDWAIAGPFYVGNGDDVPVEGEMGRLPVQGVGWYRRSFRLGSGNGNGKGERDHHNYFLDVDGAMSYPMVWLNGVLLGGWPYGYNSFRVDLTPHLRKGEGRGRRMCWR